MYDCRTCGACCVAFYEQDSFCDLRPKDIERLGKKFVRLHVIQPSLFDRFAHAFDGNEPPTAIATKWTESKVGPLKGYSFNACKMLRGSLMHRVSCRIYEKRPEVCRRAVKPGDRACKDVRRAFQAQIDRLDAT